MNTKRNVSELEVEHRRLFGNSRPEEGGFEESLEQPHQGRVVQTRTTYSIPDSADDLLDDNAED